MATPTMALAGKLIVLEGSNKVGKTSISDVLAQRLASDGLQVAQHSFPGKITGTIGALVYQIHQDSVAAGIASVSPSSLQALHIAAHIDSIERLILPKLAEGTVVILDRFWWSTWVYGQAAGVSLAQLNFLIQAEKESWDSTLPAAVFLVERNQPGEIIAYNRLGELYRTLSAVEAEAQPIFLINNTGTLEDAAAQVLHSLTQIPQYGGQ